MRSTDLKTNPQISMSVCQMNTGTKTNRLGILNSKKDAKRLKEAKHEGNQREAVRRTRVIVIGEELEMIWLAIQIQEEDRDADGLDSDVQGSGGREVEDEGGRDLGFRRWADLGIRLLGSVQKSRKGAKLMKVERVG